MFKPYVFIGTSLPPLKIDEKPDITFTELLGLLKDNLSVADFKKIEQVQNFFNVRNIRLVLEDSEIDPYGSLDKNELEDALLEDNVLPSYVIDFLNQYPTKEERLKFFPSILATYFRKEGKAASGMLKAYLQLERQMRLIAVAFRAKQLSWDIAKALQFEDPNEDFIAQLLVQKNSSTFLFPEGFEELEKIFQASYDDPLVLHKALLEYRFNKLEQSVEFDVFSLDRMIAYFIQLVLIEKWQRLDQQKGIEIIDNILKGST